MFLAALGESMQNEGEVAGVTTFSKRVLDYERYKIATPAEKKSMDQFYERITVCVGFAGGTAALAESADACRKLLTWLEEGRQPVFRVEGDVLFLLDLQAVHRTLGPQILRTSERMKERMLESLYRTITNMDREAIDKLARHVAWQMDVAFGVMRQVEDVQAGIEFSPAGIRINGSLVAHEQTTLARVLNEMDSAPHVVGKAVPKDAVAALLFRRPRTEFFNKLNADGLAGIYEMRKGQRLPMARMQQIWKALALRGGAFGPESAVALLPASGSGGTTILWAASVKDQEKATAVQAELIEERNPILALYKEFGTKYSFKEEDAEAENPNGPLRKVLVVLDEEVMPEKPRQAITRLFGGKIELATIVTPELAVGALGVGASERVKEAVGLFSQSSPSGLEAYQGYRDASGGVSTRGTFLGFFSPARLESWFGRLGTEEGSGNAEGARSGIAVGGEVVGRELKGCLFLPSSEVRAIGAAVMRAQAGEAEVPGEEE